VAGVPAWKLPVGASLSLRPYGGRRQRGMGSEPRTIQPMKMLGGGAARYLGKAGMNRFDIESRAGTTTAPREFSLLDLIPLDHLQQLQDNLARISNVKSIITDPDGNALTMPSNELPVCQLIKASGLEGGHCAGVLASLCAKTKKSQALTIEVCDSIGVVKAAVPIVVNERHMANWCISQLCSENVDQAKIAQFADRAGLDAEVLLSTVAGTLGGRRSDFDKVLSWIDQFVRQMAQLGYRNLKLSQDLNKLSDLESELDAYKTKLEVLVQERTADLIDSNKRLQLEVLERELAEEQIHRKSNLLDAINQVLHQIVTDRSEQALAGTCLQAAQTLTNSPFGFMVENQQGRWQVVSLGHQRADEKDVQPQSYPTRFEINGLWRKLVQTGESFVAQPPLEKSLWSPLPKGYPEIKTLLAVPLPSKTGVSGFIALANNENGYALVDQTDVESLAHAFAEALLRKRMEQDKYQSEKRLNLALDSAEEGLWDYFPQEEKIYYSPRWFTMLGYAEGELPYSIETWKTLAHPDDLAAITAMIESVAGGSENTFRNELRMLSQQGQWRWVQVRGRTVERDKNGEVVRIVGTMVDISKYKQVEMALQKANEELQRLAALDDLTQIANRRRFEERLADEWRRARRDRTPLGVIICDIDFFKFFNDTYGHLKGDEILYSVAQTISGTLKRPMDLVARYGGEEFAMVLPNTDLKGAHRVAKEVREAIGGLRIKHRASSVSEYITLSYGVAALMPREDTPAKTLLDHADKALYKAKAMGRNQIVVAEPEVRKDGVMAPGFNGW